MQTNRPETTRIVSYGVDFHHAPLALREKVVCTAEQVQAIAARANPGPLELVLLATCNRHELYAVFPADVADPIDCLRSILAQASGVAPDLLHAVANSHFDDAVVVHLARVAAGLESLVLGEPQIIGQVAESYAIAVELDSVGPRLSQLFRIGLRAGRRVRHETAISTQPASISSIAITLGERCLGNLQQRKIAVLGAGEMAQQALKTLRGRGAENMLVLNRTLAHAQRLATAYGGRAVSWRDRAEAMRDVDMVISAVRTDHFVVRPEHLLAPPNVAGPETRVLVDIGVPRTIDPATASVPGVQLIDLDDLTGRLDSALTTRRLEVPGAEAIIAEMLELYCKERRRDSVRPLVTSWRKKAEAVRQNELRRSARYLGERATPELMEQMDHMTRALVNKLLHEPTVNLKARAEAGDADACAVVLRELFELSLESGLQDNHG